MRTSAVFLCQSDARLLEQDVHGYIEELAQRAGHGRGDLPPAGEDFFHFNLAAYDGDQVALRKPQPVQVKLDSADRTRQADGVVLVLVGFDEVG